MMTAGSILQSAASVPSLSTRPFLATFVIALFARYGEQISAPPAWFIADIALIIMGGLAFTEVLARKNPDIRIFLDEVDSTLKAIVTLVVTFSLVDVESAAILTSVTGDPAGSSVLSMGFGAINSAATWFTSVVRKGFFELFTDADEDDDVGLQGCLSWLEDFGAIGWVAFAVVAAGIALAIFAITLITLYIVQKIIDRQIEQSKVACSQCTTRIYPTAPVCHSCGTPNRKLYQVGFFGQPTSKLADNPAGQRFQLLTRRQCPTCATRLEKKSIHQTCPTCGTETFANAEAVEDYLANLEAGLYRIVVIAGLLSIIPVLGLIPATIYYRLSLIANMRRYIPTHVGCVTRWGVRLLNLIVIALQIAPGISAVSMAIMVYLNFHVYKRILRHESQKAFGKLPEASSSQPAIT